MSRYSNWIFTARERRTGKKPVTLFELSPGREFERWMHQNGAEYAGPYVDGVLLDSFVVSTRRGYAAIYETYRNEWTSTYTVTFQPGSAPDVWKEWEAFEAAAEAATA